MTLKNGDAAYNRRKATKFWLAEFTSEFTSPGTP
jgi:hypothetical protein